MGVKSEQLRARVIDALQDVKGEVEYVLETGQVPTEEQVRNFLADWEDVFTDILA